MKIRIFLLSLIGLTINIACGYSADKTVNENNGSFNQDSHDQGVTTCEASVVPVYPDNAEDNTKCKVVYTSFNGAVCSTLVFDNIDQCNETADNTPEIQVEEPTTPPSTISSSFKTKG